MKLVLLPVLLILISSLAAVGQGINGVTPGMSRADVIALLGTPQGSLTRGADEIVLFSNGTVTFREGKLLSCKLSSPGPSDAKPRPHTEPSPAGEDAKQTLHFPPPSQASPSMPPATAGRIGAFDWQTDFAKAAVDAAQAHRYMLLDFTGSDWCHFCIKLDGEVFSTPEFKSFAAIKFVCVQLDFPRQHPLSAMLKKQNTELAKAYAIRGYPTVIILSPTGELVGRQVGYRGDGPQKYTAMLQTMVSEYEKKHPAI